MLRTDLTTVVLTGLLLVACGGDDGPSTTGSSDAGTSDDTSGGTDDATTGASDATDATTDATDATTNATTDDVTATETGSACDACSPDATCVGGQLCECNDGFSGDGFTCADVDECESGQNTCDADATCENTPGSYTCACNDGYKGNGMSCKDIDECGEGSDDCDVNASCTNNDGGYSCECDEGFTGDGFTCNGSKEFGEVCEEGSECASGLCLIDTQCTVECSIAQSANDCRDQGYYGLCIIAGDDLFVCAGDIKTGADKDDAIVGSGDTLTRQFQSVTDMDIFLVEVPPGMYQMYAEPDPDDDIAVIFYNIDGSLLAQQDKFGPGQIEGANVTAAGDPLYAIVANVGNSNGSYKFVVEAL
ncbi:MAG: hypothetical protein KC636_11265 [Myxococcales bacterium]|nr:hypothetical protein [Myxococcales bacterium]